LRMEDERIAKEKVLNGKLRNTMSVGKPRTQRADVVQRDALQVPRIRGWRRRAGERKERRRFLGEARAQKGPQRHTWVAGQLATVLPHLNVARRLYRTVSNCTAASDYHQTP
jgi:hypothetical protein